MSENDVADALGELQCFCVSATCAVFEANLCAIGEACVDGDDALAGASILDRAGTGGVVPDAASDAGVASSRWVGGEEETAGRNCVVEIVDGDAGFNIDGLCGNIEIVVLIDSYCSNRSRWLDKCIDRRGWCRRRGGAWQCCAEARGRSVDAVRDIGRNHDAQRFNLVERGVGRIEHPDCENRGVFRPLTLEDSLRMKSAGRG